MCAVSNTIAVCFKWWLQKSEKKRGSETRKNLSGCAANNQRAGVPHHKLLIDHRVRESSLPSKWNKVKKRPTTMAQIEQIQERRWKKNELIKIHSSVLKFETVWNRSKGVCARIQVECKTYVRWFFPNAVAPLAIHIQTPHAVTQHTRSHNAHTAAISNISSIIFHYFHHDCRPNGMNLMKAIRAKRLQACLSNGKISHGFVR